MKIPTILFLIMIAAIFTVAIPIIYGLITAIKNLFSSPEGIRSLIAIIPLSLIILIAAIKTYFDVRNGMVGY